MAVAPRLYYDLSPYGLVLYRPSTGGAGYVPILVLLVGPGNVLEAAPRTATPVRSGVLSVACADGWVVLLDIGEGTARRRGPQGEQVYDGGLEEGNEGKGWIPVSG
jgi:hypothetical protein